MRPKTLGPMLCCRSHTKITHEKDLVQVFILDDSELGVFEIIKATKLNKSEIYQEKKPWTQVNVYLRKSKLITTTIHQFIL